MEKLHPTNKKDMVCGQPMMWVKSRKVQHDIQETFYHCDVCGCWYSDYSDEFWHEGKGDR